MAYELHFHEENEILLVKISGEREKKELVSTARNAWGEIAKRSSEKGLSVECHHIANGKMCHKIANSLSICDE